MINSFFSSLEQRCLLRRWRIKVILLREIQMPARNMNWTRDMCIFSKTNVDPVCGGKKL